MKKLTFKTIEKKEILNYAFFRAKMIKLKNLTYRLKT